MTTPWLDETEMRLWRAFVEVSWGVVQQLDAALKADAGLTFEDYEVLVHLSEADDHRLRMSDLSSRLLHSQSRLTQRVDRLSNRGLVVRQRCDDDRRVVYAVLTEDGLALLVRAAPDHVRQVRRHLLDLIDADEIAPVATALERVAAQLRSGDAVDANEAS